MSKALKALEKIANLPMKEQYDVVYKDGKPMVVYRVVADLCGKEIKTIKTTIKNYEELTNRPVILYGRTNGHTKALIDMICKNYKEVKITNLVDEKKVKALDAIKEIFNLRVYEKQGQFFICSGLNGETPISKEKADLLKEALL